MIGGIIAGFAIEDLVRGAAWDDSPHLYVMSIPENIGVGKITNVTFITFSEGTAVANANLTLSGSATASGLTGEHGMVVLAVNATSNGSINVSTYKPGYKNTTSFIKATPELAVVSSPASITSGTATYVTISVTGVGKPVSDAAVNLSGAGVALEGATNSNGQLIVQVNTPDTGAIAVTAKKEGYVSGSTGINSAAQQTLSVSSSQTAATVNVPVYVTFTVTAGGAAVNEAEISVSGAATGSGITNLDGKVIILLNPQATGTITVSASKTGYAGGSTTITSAGTQSLSISSNPGTVIGGVPAYVTFTVTSGNNAVSGATVTLTGASSGTGITNQNGQVIMLVNSTAGTITATATNSGYSSGSTTLNAIGQQALSVSASLANVTNGMPTYVTFTVTSGGSAVSGATVNVIGGGISVDGLTNSAGQVTLQLTATGAGAINVYARKAGYVDGTTAVAH